MSRAVIREEEMFSIEDCLSQVLAQMKQLRGVFKMPTAVVCGSLQRDEFIRLGVLLC